MRPMSVRMTAVAALLFSWAGLAAQTASGSVAGTVTDQNQAPVVGATVYAVSGPAMTGAANAVQTDNDGKFRIYNLPPGNYVLTAFKTQDGYGNPEQRFYGGAQRVLTPVTVSQATLAEGVSINLGRAGGTLHIMAYDAATQKPLNHISYVLRRSGHPEAVLQGDKNLPATFLVPAADITVQLFVDGYQPWNYSEDGHDYITMRTGDSRDITANLHAKPPTAK